MPQKCYYSYYKNRKNFKQFYDIISHHAIYVANKFQKEIDMQCLTFDQRFLQEEEKSAQEAFP